MEELLKRKKETITKLSKAQQELKEEENGFVDLQYASKVFKLSRELERICTEITLYSPSLQ